MLAPGSALLPNDTPFDGHKCTTSVPAAPLLAAVDNIISVGDDGNELAVDAPINNLLPADDVLE